MHRRAAPAAAGSVSAEPGRSPGRRLLSIFALATILLPAALAGCVPQASAGSLPATLSMRDVSGGSVAVQDGIAVPSFDPQPRDTLDLSGSWRVERATFDSSLTLADRRLSLGDIEDEAGGRQLPSYDDTGWPELDVPGTVNPPPDRAGGSAWYRLHFSPPAGWSGRTLTLKFGAANYVADVWLNGHYLGYHEGGFTPFAFDASLAAQPGKTNVLAVRVDDPVWGTRNDIVPWGLADWWDYGGLTQRVWLEASPSLLVARADVVPHLDGADVSVTVENRGRPDVSSGDTANGGGSTDGNVMVEILPATIQQSSLLDPSAMAAIDPGDVSHPIAVKEFRDVHLAAHGIAMLEARFALAGASTWSLGHPALYVVRATAIGHDGTLDQLVQTFGLRHVAVDPQAPRILLNGSPIAFTGVAVHDEQIATTSGPGPYAGPIVSAEQAYRQLQRARTVQANLVRTAHQPAVPSVLSLADRLGIAVWEEIPLYHFTPLTFQVALGRGIPQQMLREMALRDMDHPSVLFYGLANESTGGAERSSAMATLKGVADDVDGTRLTGQASYGFAPSDPTSAALDVAGYTFYYGVFYGDDIAADTATALQQAHARYPSKPLMILEFGRWADPPLGPLLQQNVFETTQGALAARTDVRAGGYVAGTVWWALDDYFTMRPGITLERFGLFDADGIPRPAAESATAQFGQALSEVPSQPLAERPAAAPGAAHAVESTGSTLRLAGYLVYGLLVSAAMLALLLGLSLGRSRLRGGAHGGSTAR